MATATSFTVKPDDNIGGRNLVNKKNAKTPLRRAETYLVKAKTHETKQRKAFGNVTNVTFANPSTKPQNKIENKTIPETPIKPILDDKYPPIEYAPINYQEDDTFQEPNWSFSKDQLYDLFKPQQKPSYEFCKENNLLDDLPKVDLELENIGPGEIEIDLPSLDFVKDETSGFELPDVSFDEDENDSFGATFVVEDKMIRDFVAPDAKFVVNR